MEFLWKISTQKVLKKCRKEAQKLKYGLQSLSRESSKGFFLEKFLNKDQFVVHFYSKLIFMLEKANWRSFQVKNSSKNVKDSFKTSNNSTNQKITPIKDDPIPHRHLIISSLFKNQLKANLIISRIKFKPVASNKIKKQFIRHKQKTS